MTKYVILKKIDGIWFATERRYTLEELKEVCNDNNLNCNYELLLRDGWNSLARGTQVKEDDGRELIRDGKHSYLNDKLKVDEPLQPIIEEQTHTLRNIMIGLIGLIALGKMIGVWALVLIVVVAFVWFCNHMKGGK